MLTNFTHLADCADGALVFGMVLGSVKRTLLVRSTAIDGSVASSANFELSELIVFNLNRIVRVALALSFYLACLFGQS